MTKTVSLFLSVAFVTLFGCVRAPSLSEVATDSQDQLAVAKTGNRSPITLYEQEHAELQQKKAEIQKKVNGLEHCRVTPDSIVDVVGKSCASALSSAFFASALGAVVVATGMRPERIFPYFFGALGVGGSVPPIVFAVDNLKKYRYSVKLGKLTRERNHLEVVDDELWVERAVISPVSLPHLLEGLPLPAMAQKHPNAHFALVGTPAFDDPEELTSLRLNIALIPHEKNNDLHTLQVVESSGSIVFSQAIQFVPELGTMVRGQRTEGASVVHSVDYFDVKATNSMSTPVSLDRLSLDGLYEKTYDMIMEYALEHLAKKYGIKGRFEYLDYFEAERRLLVKRAQSQAD